MESADFESILDLLVRHDVDFVLVGALSAVLHGAPIMTFDVDIVHARDEANVGRLMKALAELDAHYRHKPELRPTPDYLRGRGHQLLTTRFGPLDVLGFIEDDLEYDDLLEHSNPMKMAGADVLVLGPEKYLEFKKGSTQPKDLAMLPVLKALLESGE